MATGQSGRQDAPVLIGLKIGRAYTCAATSAINRLIGPGKAVQQATGLGRGGLFGGGDFAPP